MSGEKTHIATQPLEHNLLTPLVRNAQRLPLQVAMPLISWWYLACLHIYLHEYPPKGTGRRASDTAHS